MVIGQCDFFVTFCIVQNFVLLMYEICNGSYIRLDFCFTYELCSVPNIIRVIYATCTMGAVRIVKYKEENCSINLIEQKGMTLNHNFGYSFPLISYLLIKEGRRKGECHAFLLDLLICLNYVCLPESFHMSISHQFFLLQNNLFQKILW